MADINENEAFQKDLERLINRHSLENESGTPDYILASYLQQCLDTFNKVIALRATWRGEALELPALFRLAEEDS